MIFNFFFDMLHLYFHKQKEILKFKIKNTFKLIKNPIFKILVLLYRW